MTTRFLSIAIAAQIALSHWNQLEHVTNARLSCASDTGAIAAIPGFTLNTSVLLAGNWIDGHVSWGDDESLATRVLTRFSGQVRRFCLNFACAH